MHLLPGAVPSGRPAGARAPCRRPAGVFSTQQALFMIKNQMARHHAGHPGSQDGIGYSKGTTRVVGSRLRVLGLFLGREPAIPKGVIFLGHI
jgi:hypothetical protein